MTSELFGYVQEYPDPEAGIRFDALVGLDGVKTRLVTEAAVLIRPDVLESWSQELHGHPIKAIRTVTDRVPLIVLAGDVGTGKTEVAETIGHPISMTLGLDITMYPLSLTARGTGLVGQMTTLITGALNEVREMAAKARNKDGGLNRAIILLVDEADSVAQSRELTQMHHEDRAGVNALIQGIDGFRRDHLPVLTIMCTNRPDALDPAVARRAAHVFALSRPNEEQRGEVLSEALGDAEIDATTIERIARLLGPTDDRDYGATYSDLRQRFVPDAVLDAYERSAPITAERLVHLATSFSPTRPFGQAD